MVVVNFVIKTEIVLYDGKVSALSGYRGTRIYIMYLTLGYHKNLIYLCTIFPFQGALEYFADALPGVEVM